MATSTAGSAYTTTQSHVRRVETALDWYRRSKRRKLHVAPQQANGGGGGGDGGKDGQVLPWWASFSSNAAAPAENPVKEAHRILWGGHTGIAPVDAAWKLATSNLAAADQLLQQNLYDEDEDGISMAPSSPHPPMVILEGPKGFGKTWTMLSLAARFVVATRPSRFADAEIFDTGADGDNNGNEAQSQQPPERNILPQVIFLDSNFDFSISKLTHIVRCLLMRENSRNRQPQKWTAAATGVTSNANKVNNGMNQQATENSSTALEEEDHILEVAAAAERRQAQLEGDVDECLSRIHVIQVDNGTTGWVPVLEALRHELRMKRRENMERHETWGAHTSSGAATAPTLLLWDGCLADVGNDTSAREIFQQISRILKQEPYLWCVLSARTSRGASASPYGSRVGNLLVEWMKQQWHRKQQQQQQQQLSDLQRSSQSLPREVCRVRFERAMVAGEPSATTSCAFTATVISATNNIPSTNNSGTKVPYSLSLQGILS
jgi:hypothetical protein